MRLLGKIITWKDDQGFGFITPKGGGDQVFVHIKAFSNRQRRPTVNDLITYELTSDERGRKRAERVCFVADGDTPAASTGRNKRLLLPTTFLALLAAAVAADRAPLPVLGLYAVISAITFLVYAKDKSAAQGRKRRTSEAALHLFSVLGGWPGAIIAQELLRHKSKKESFRFDFWITVVLNCIALAWLLSPRGSQALRSIIGPP